MHSSSKHLPQQGVARERSGEVTAMEYQSRVRQRRLLPAIECDMAFLLIDTWFSRNMIYSFEGWGSSVLVLAQSPALDIVGAGLANGDVMIHNLKTDTTLMKFTQDWGPVSIIAFRAGQNLYFLVKI